jgi:hypothetical protein
MGKLRGRLTYANVMATIAVFIALGGASYAATLAKNSVGTKQLKKNAVTTTKLKKQAVTADKVKNRTLTGAQIDTSTLGTVPRANTANTATTANIANSIAPSEPWHVVGTPGEPQFQHGCENVEGEGPPVRFYKDHESVVHLEGVYGSCIGAVAFELPAGFRPGALLQFPMAGGGDGVAALVPSFGGVSCGKTTCHLNGITFRAES